MSELVPIGEVCPPWDDVELRLARKLADSFGWEAAKGFKIPKRFVQMNMGTVVQFNTTESEAMITRLQDNKVLKRTSRRYIQFSKRFNDPNFPFDLDKRPDRPSGQDQDQDGDDNECTGGRTE